MAERGGTCRESPSEPRVGEARRRFRSGRTDTSSNYRNQSVQRVGDRAVFFVGEKTSMSRTDDRSNEASRSRRSGSSAPDVNEIHSAINAEIYPPILTVRQAAALLQVSHHTLYRAVSEGRFKSAVRRGKPLRSWRDRLIQAFFST